MKTLIMATNAREARRIAAEKGLDRDQVLWAKDWSGMLGLVNVEVVFAEEWLENAPTQTVQMCLEQAEVIRVRRGA